MSAIPEDIMEAAAGAIRNYDPKGADAEYGLLLSVARAIQEERERNAKVADAWAAAPDVKLPFDGYFAGMQRAIGKGMDGARKQVAATIAASIRKGRP